MELGHLENRPWPAWRYGPDGVAQVFEKEEDVPEGWFDHPSKVGQEPEEKPEVKRRGRPPAVEMKPEDF